MVVRHRLVVGWHMVMGRWRGSRVLTMLSVGSMRSLGVVVDRVGMRVRMGVRCSMGHATAVHMAMGDRLCRRQPR